MRRAPSGRAAGAAVGALAALLVAVGLAGDRAAPAGFSAQEPRRGFLSARDAGAPARAWTWQLDPGVRWQGGGEALHLQPRLADDGWLWLQRGGARVGLSGRGEVRTDGLQCPAGLSWGGEAVTLDGQGLALGERRVCTGDRGPGLVLEAGNRRVDLRDLQVDGRSVGPRLAPVRSGLLLAVGAGVGAALPLPAVLLLPLLLGLSLLALDPAGLAEALWVQQLASPWLPAAVGLSGAAFLGLLRQGVPVLRGSHHLPRWVGPLSLVAWLACGIAVAHDGLQVLGLLAGLAVVAGGALLAARRLALDPTPLLTAALVPAAVAAVGGLGADPLAVVGLGGAGLALVFVLGVNLNARRLPAFNLLSLAGVGVLLVLLELGLSHSTPARAWRAALTWNARHTAALDEDDVAVVALDDFEALERGDHPTYPARGYPVAYGPRQAPTRVVCLGGSSTGGAWQFDDLGAFYPARLDALLGDEVEVLNQGVGGWTSWHVRRYLEAQLADLDADILTLYLGNNDGGSGYPAPISALHASWQARQQGGPLSLLERLALVQWLRVALAPRVQAADSPAVTVQEHGENLAAILALAGERRVLLVGEANNQGGAHLRDYYAQQQALARTHPQVAYLHGPAVLPASEPGLFLDYAHPTQAGHERLAQAIGQALRAQGWVR